MLAWLLAADQGVALEIAAFLPLCIHMGTGSDTFEIEIWIVQALLLHEEGLPCMVSTEA